MQDMLLTQSIQNFYSGDEYILKNPSLHEEDSPWKVSQIIPLIDVLMLNIEKNEINLLDVGGGAGLILSLVSTHIEKNHHKKVNKFALDLSPGMLKIQEENNPDITIALNEDICSTSLGDKQIDLTLMIDVIEHIPDPEKALRELRRISHYVIFKVPIEDNLTSNMVSIITRGKNRRYTIETVGHINIFNFKRLKNMIENYNGTLVKHYYTNCFNYVNTSLLNKDKKISIKAISYIGEQTFKLSPKLSAFLLCNHIMILVKSYDR